MARLKNAEFSFNHLNRVVSRNDVTGLLVRECIVQVCFTVGFPEIARELALQGADVLIVPTAWVHGPLKEQHFQALVSARALENTLPVPEEGQAPAIRELRARLRLFFQMDVEICATMPKAGQCLPGCTRVLVIYIAVDQALLDAHATAGDTHCITHRFHRYLMSLTNNDVFLELSDNIRQRVYYQPDPLRRHAYYTASTEEHRAIVAG